MSAVWSEKEMPVGEKTFESLQQRWMSRKTALVSVEHKRLDVLL